MRILKRMFTPEGRGKAPAPAFVRLGLAALLAASVILPVAGVAPAAAQQKRIVQVPNADYFGGDYRTVKDVDIATCESACLDDRQCKAFTYNTSARWCFLKNTQGELQAFSGAIAGRVVEVKVSSKAAIAERRAELSFVSNYYMEEAQRYASQVTRTSTPVDAPIETQLQQAEQDLLMSYYSQAQTAFASLLAVDATNSAAWTGMSLAQVNQQPDDWELRMALRRNSISAAVNGYLNAVDGVQQGAALEALSRAFALSQEWKPAIRSLRKARELNPADTPLGERYEQMVADHGFRILDHRVDADAAEPRICVIFSDELEKNRDFSDFLKVLDTSGTAVSADGSQLCVTGVRHGQRYDMQVRAGITANDGEQLERSRHLSIYIRDRAPSVHFLGRAYVLPKGKDATIPVVSVNSKEVALEIFRVGDRGLVDVVRDERFMRQLSYYDSSQLEDELGEKVWSGVVETASPLNEDVTTAIPLEDIGLELKPGVYAMSAKSKLDTADEWSAKATQWFIVSDIGLSSYSGTEGVIASLRSLSSAKPMEGVTVRLVAVNNEVLGEVVSDANGLAAFTAGLSRGRGGRAPALVVAETAEGDYSFLDLRKPAFDLSDRGVEAVRPRPLDVFSWTDKGIYRSGETVHAQALLRTAKADAQTDLPLTFIFVRPDGVEYSRTVINDGGLGGYLQDLVLPAGIQQGSWTLRVYLDPKGSALAEKTFLVEDYQPERVDYTLKASAEALSIARPVDVTVEGRFLYGAPAANQTLEGEIIVAPVRNLAAFPGYVFGLSDEGIYPERASLPEGLATDENGAVTFPLSLPQLQPTSGLYTSTLITRLVETGGRYVERSLDLPVLPGGPRIGVKPLFSGGVDEGGPAEYEIVLIDENGKQIAGKDLTWTLSRIDRSYQWYRSDGQWNYEPVTSSERVSSGKIDVPSDAPARLSLPVNWGEYKLEVSLGGNQPAETSDTFSAGWYSAGGSSDTPDRLEVGLDKSAYRPGETAILRLKPKTEGVAIINVFAEGLLETKTVEVDGSETEVSLAVTDDWGAGAYVTATLLRPMDIDAKRMPARSLGLAWGQVEPGDRKLSVEITAPETMRPRQELTATLKLANVPAGEKAYVTLAAVDVGILNLTGYKAPEPSSWYFGQRRLGIEIRDLYGQLIDRTAGTRGTVRSGGDGGSGLKAPPPDEEPVALFSGIVEVSDDGTAAIVFDVPDFNGTLKLMAVAWSAGGVGEASRDVQVRDPVVMSTSMPAFMAPGIHRAS
ncbi:MG2 domain-containing protein [Pannonibacter sp. Pt2-lr]